MISKLDDVFSTSCNEVEMFFFYWISLIRYGMLTNTLKISWKLEKCIQILSAKKCIIGKCTTEKNFFSSKNRNISHVILNEMFAWQLLFGIWFVVLKPFDDINDSSFITNTLYLWIMHSLGILFFHDASFFFSTFLFRFNFARLCIVQACNWIQIDTA